MPQSRERLRREGEAALESFEEKRAYQAGKALVKLGDPYGYELMARACLQDDRFDKAVEVLRNGTKAAPHLWGLWELLGITLSDIDDFAAAHEAYDRALAVEGASEPSIQYNRALAMQREGRSREALDLLRNLEHEARADAALWPKWQVFEVELLTEQSRYLDACGMAETLLASGMEDEDTRARLHAHYARALWKGFRRGREALEQAWKAIAINRWQPTAMFMIRDVENAKSADAHEYRLLIYSDCSIEVEGGGVAKGFFTTYWVVADSPDEALTYVQRFEPPDTRYRLSIKEAEKFEPRPNQPKGVYQVSGRAF